MRWNPEVPDAPEKALLIQFRRIGDAVLVTPALDALRRAWPDTRLHFLTADPVPDLFAGDPRVDVLWIRPPRLSLPSLARDLRQERFGVVFDFQSLPLTATLARATGAWAVGFAKRARGALYHRTVRVQDHRGSGFAADHKLDLLRAAGLPVELGPPRLPGPAPSAEAWAGLPEGPRVVLVPVSRRPHKRWEPEAFARTARELHRRTGAVFLLAGGPGEGDTLEGTAAMLGDAPRRVQVFDRLQNLAGALGAAALFLGNDNGPRHVAMALGVPTLAYFGTQNPTHWTPPADPRQVVIWDPARSRGRPVRPDLNLVPPDPEAAAEAGAALLTAGPGS